MTFPEQDIQTRLKSLRQQFLERENSPQPELSPQQVERERFQWHSNKWAEQHPLYASARSAAVHQPILPLEPLGTRPLVPITDATMDPSRILQWWMEAPEANIGVVVGRPFLIAMHVRDLQAQANLRALRAVECYDDDTGQHWTEYQSLDPAILRFQARATSFKAITGWGKEIDKPLRDIEQASKNTPEEMYFLWSYPDLPMDAHDFRSRRVVPGVDVLPVGTVLPWAGSRFKGGQKLIGADSGPLPVIPTWLAAKIGQPRSRKTMQATIEGYHAAKALEGMWPTVGWEDKIRIERVQPKELPAPEKVASAGRE